jgi:hypothetical protein
MSVDVHDAFIIEFENMFSDSICDELINFFDTNPTDSTFMLRNTNSSTLKKLKTSTDTLINPQIRNHMMLNDKYQRILKTVKYKYADAIIEKGLDIKSHVNGQYQISSFIKSSRQTGLIVQKSEVGQYYNWHTDFMAGEDRLLTCILYLNDVEDDAGGTTEFASGRIVKPRKGKVLIFPSTITYVHRGNKVEKDSKYIITTFSIYSHHIKKTFPFIVS